jgi:TRAP-type C4-dicarboxylate transport system permease small subunit
MRNFLDNLYRLSGGLAAGFIVLICLAVMLQVIATIIDKAVGWVSGTPIGLIIPSYAEFTGFFLAAATFFGLAYTLRADAHVRVSLVVSHLNARYRRWFEIWCLGSGAALAAYAGYYTFNLVYESYIFNDLAVGMVPLPIWIPQLSMALGMLVLLIALLDDLVTVLRGFPASYETVENAEASAAESSSSVVG